MSELSVKGVALEGATLAGAARAAPSRSRRWLRRGLGLGTLFVVLPTVVIGLAHTRAFGPTLGRLFGMSSGCPVSLEGMKPEQIEAHRARASVVLAGALPSRAKRIGPFAIGTTTRDDVQAWAKSEAIATCNAEQSGIVLRCIDVPAKALTSSIPSAPQGKDVFFRFTMQGVLVGLDIMREPCDGTCAENLARDLGATVERDIGKATTQHGELAAAYFDAPGIRMTITEHRFTDLAVDVSVSRHQLAGPLTVREQYRSVEKPAL